MKLEITLSPIFNVGMSNVMPKLRVQVDPRLARFFRLGNGQNDASIRKEGRFRAHSGFLISSNYT